MIAYTIFVYEKRFGVTPDQKFLDSPFMKGGKTNSLVMAKHVFENIKPMYPTVTFGSSVHSQFTQGFLNVWIVI